MKVFLSMVPSKLLKWLEYTPDGYLVTPHNVGWAKGSKGPATRTPDDIPMIVDNGAYRNRNEDELLDPAKNISDMKSAISAVANPVHFVVLTDRFGDWENSIKLSRQAVELWGDEYPKALVLQDGFTPEDVEPFLNVIEYLFIGGSDWDFKVKAIEYALTTDLKIHVARVSRRYQILWCLRKKVDSIDNSTWANNLNLWRRSGRDVIKQNIELIQNWSEKEPEWL